jgi:hypothetical protein
MTLDTSGSDLEAALGRSFSIPVPVHSRDVIDRRVEVAIADETARRASRVRGFRFPGPVRLLFAGVAVAVLLTGTVAAGGTIFSQLLRGAPLMENVWDRATEIDQSSTDAGYTIHLERAAADREHVWVIVSVTAASGAEAGLGRMRVVDANGVVISGGTGAGTGDIQGVSAELYGLHVPAGVTPHGPFTLDVTSVWTAGGVPREWTETPGHWTFTFDVPLTAPFNPDPASVTVRPDAP